MKLVTVVGARPQFIKAAMLSRQFLFNSDISEVIIHTGQHYDLNMSDVFFNELKIPEPKYFLNVKGGGHGGMTGQMIAKIEEVLLVENPDWVILYGDTNSTLAGAIAASKLNIKIAHVEAGLRSFNDRMPEEINRIITDRVSNMLFCPSMLARDNLVKEGFLNMDKDITVPGDIMFDAVRHFSTFVSTNQAVRDVIDSKGSYALATIHRAENTTDDKKIKDIFKSLDDICSETTVIMPLHPRTRALISDLKIATKVKFLSPVGYVDMLNLVSSSSIVITDSGGLQKEAYYLRKHCITVRDETEWTELVDSGYNIIVGTDPAKVIFSI